MDALTVHRSVYLHRNYFSERIKQATDTEPRFTSLEQGQIYRVFSILHEADPPSWCEPLFSKQRFGRICRVLDLIRPHQRWKQKLERWLQAKHLIFGPDYACEMMDDMTAFQLKVMFDPIAYVFSKYFKEDAAGKHNIPKLDLVCLFLLFQLGESYVERFGWYFLNDRIAWETSACETDMDRLLRICAKCNDDPYAVPVIGCVRPESKHWVHSRKYKPTTVGELVGLATRRTSGKDMLTSLVLDLWE